MNIKELIAKLAEVCEDLNAVKFNDIDINELFELQLFCNELIAHKRLVAYQQAMKNEDDKSNESNEVVNDTTVCNVCENCNNTECTCK